MYWLIAIVYFSLTVHAYDYGHNYENNYKNNDALGYQHNYVNNFGYNYQKDDKNNQRLLFDAEVTYNPCQQGSGVYYHPNPKNIHEFYQCDDFGVAYLRSCGGDLVWDDAHTTCNWPDAIAGQSSSGTLSSSTTTTTATIEALVPTGTEESATGEAEGSAATETEGSVPTGTEGSARKGTEESATEETEGPVPTGTEESATGEAEGSAPTEAEASATAEPEGSVPTEIEESATAEAEASAPTEIEVSSTNKTVSPSSLCDEHNPCGEHGQCVELLPKGLSSTKNVACVCDENWFGRLCDKKVDDLTTPASAHDETQDFFQPSPSTTILVSTTTTTVPSISLCAQITPCGEHGQCADLATTDASGSLQFSCICDKDWTGPLCDKHIGDVKESVLNVHVNENKKKLGTTAEVSSVSLCAQITPCGEHGQCVDLATTDASESLQFSCICDKDWTGPLCDKHIGDVKKSVLNVHVDEDKKKLGTTAEVSSISFCDEHNPCGEHGQCVDSTTTDGSSGLQFSCICDKDWSGSLCDKHIGDVKKPVLNIHVDGNKKKLITGTSFSSISLCDKYNVCGEHGKCVQTHLTSLSAEPQITCVCDENWFGRLCDKRIDDLTTPLLSHDIVENKNKTRETFSLPVYTKEDAKYIFYGLKGDNKLKLSASVKKRMMDPKEQNDVKDMKPSEKLKRALTRITRGDMK